MKSIQAILFTLSLLIVLITAKPYITDEAIAVEHELFLGGDSSIQFQIADNSNYIDIFNSLNIDMNINTNGSSYDIPNIIYWSQMDPRWANDSYFVPGIGTIGSVGCALTSICMVTAYVTNNSIWEPDYVNDGRFIDAVNQLEQANLGPFTNLYYNIPPGFLPAGTPEAIQFKQRVRVAIFNNFPVVLGFKLNGPPDHHIEHGWVRHTVLATGVDVNGDINLHDPATGKPGTLSSYEARSQFTGFDLGTAVLNVPGGIEKKVTNY